jgi:hypothetical protein
MYIPLTLKTLPGHAVIKNAKGMEYVLIIVMNLKKVLSEVECLSQYLFSLVTVSNSTAV